MSPECPGSEVDPYIDPDEIITSEDRERILEMGRLVLLQRSLIKYFCFEFSMKILSTKSIFNKKVLAILFICEFMTDGVLCATTFYKILGRFNQILLKILQC